jgi:hypothetical protein
MCTSGWDSVRLGWGPVIRSFGHGNKVLASYKESTSSYCKGQSVFKNSFGDYFAVQGLSPFKTKFKPRL